MFLFSIIVFIAGILTFLAPCTLPILPAYLSFSTQPGRASAFLRTVSFGAGVALIFLVLGVLAGSLGSLITVHKQAITIASGILFIALGILVLSGRGIPGFTINTTPARTAFGSFLFGLLFALSWSGCIGPVLGVVLILAANTQTAIGGGILLLIYTAGLLLPLILISFFIDRLPRDGKLWRLMKGRPVHIGKWEVQSTELITGSMFILLGIIFLSGITSWLSGSPLIGKIFDLEDALLNAINTTS